MRKTEQEMPQNNSKDLFVFGGSDKVKMRGKVVGLLIVVFALWNLFDVFANAFDPTSAKSNIDQYGSDIASVFANLGWVLAPFSIGLVLFMWRVAIKPIALSAVVIALAILISSLFGTYNSLIYVREQTEEQLGNIRVAYQQRFDLIPDLVRVAREPLAQEQTIQTDLAKARQDFASTKDVNGTISSANQFEDTLRRFLMLSESYPQLRETTEFQNVQASIISTGESLAAERILFNERAKEYNLLVKSFPTVFFAQKFGFDGTNYWNDIAGTMSLVPSATTGE